MTKIDETIILAPLLGFTDLTYRNVYTRHFSGLDEAIAPFISTMGQQKLNASKLKDVDLDLNLSVPITPQIMGNNARDFVYLANHLYENGHGAVNWNLGCPHSKIAKKQRGSGLLLYPERIDELLEAILPALKPTLSVKIRLGRRNKDEIYRLVETFDRHQITEIILHPRTGEQMYTGTSDHDAFEKAMAASRHPFVYNGDIVDMASYNRVRERFPQVHRIMIGRGILSNPFLAEEIKDLPAARDLDQASRLDRIRTFHDDLVAEYAKVFAGPGHLTDRMKGFWTYMGPAFEGHKKPLKQILKSPNFDVFRKRVDAFFDLGLPHRPENHGNN